MTTNLVPFHESYPVAIDPEMIKPEPLSLGEYELLKEALIEGKRADARNLLICKMLFGTGLREAELLRLTPSKVIQQGPDVLIWVYRGKRNGQVQWERVPLRPELGADLMSYIRGNKITHEMRIFDISARQLQRIIKSAGMKALGRPVHPHMFRSLYIKYLIDNRLPVAAVAKMVGHEDERTTQKHYYDLTMEQRHDINRRIPV